MPLIAAYSVWWLTFIAGFVVLGPAIDDGYYIEFAINSMNGHGPGFWVGDTFSPVFFVFPSFAWFYGKTLWLLSAVGGDFGPLAFRLPHLVILLAFPLVLHRWLRFLDVVHRNHVLLTLTAFLATSYFFQQAITVRPELLCLLLLLLGWTLLPKIEQGGKYFYCLLFGLLTGCGMIMHPVFTFVNGCLIGSLIVKQLRADESQLKQKIKNLGFVSGGALLPIFLFLLHMYANRSDVSEQLFQRVSEVSPRSFEIFPKAWNDLLQVNARESVFYYIYAAYPTMVLLVLVVITTFIILRNGRRLWESSSHWPFLPLSISAIVLFCFLQPYPPYLLFYNFIFAAIVVVCGFNMRFLQKKWYGNIFCSFLFVISFVFISIHLAKSHIGNKSKYLNPIALYDAVGSELAETEVLLFTTTARIMPPLIKFYESKENGSRIKTFIFSPQEPSRRNKQIGISFLENTSKADVSPEFLFAADKKHVTFKSDERLWINVQDLDLEAHIVHGGIIYQDQKNLIIRVKSMCVVATGQALATETCWPQGP